MTKETTSQRKTRHAERLDIVQLWCKAVRKHTQLPELLKGSLTALVEQDHKNFKHQSGSIFVRREM